MNRLGKAIGITMLGLATAAFLPTVAVAQSGESHLQAPPSPAPAGTVAKSSMLAGAALAIRSLAIWRNAMPRVLQPGQKDPGSPLIVKAEIEATAKAAVKMTWKAELVPGGAPPQPLQNLEVSSDSAPWTGELKPGAQTYIEFYSKSDSTLAPGTKAKLVVTFTAGGESVTLEQETTVEKVD